MNKTLVSIFTIVLLAASPVILAQGNSSNASQGTKALLQRIEALEAIVADLVDGGSTPDVSGKTYHTYSYIENLAAFNPPVSGQFSTMAVLARELNFHANGTGEWIVRECMNNQLIDIASGQPFILSTPQGCTGPQLAPDFTWVQSGNMVELTFPQFPAPVFLSVSNDGNTIARASGGLSGDASTPNRIMSSAMTIGVQVSD